METGAKGVNRTPVATLRGGRITTIRLRHLRKDGSRLSGFVGLRTNLFLLTFAGVTAQIGSLYEDTTYTTIVS